MLRVLGLLAGTFIGFALGPHIGFGPGIALGLIISVVLATAGDWSKLKAWESELHFEKPAVVPTSAPTAPPDVAVTPAPTTAMGQAQAALRKQAEPLIWLAKRGDAGAQYALGRMYLSGRGFPVDYAKAAQLFQQSAAQGHAEATYYLGFMHEHGCGFEQNAFLALQLYVQAAGAGDPRAQERIAEFRHLSGGDPG